MHRIYFIHSKMSEKYPELEALAGPLKGSSFLLSDLEISIGREPSNLVPILDASVSRRHCLIRREAEQFKIQDLNSRNSTFVNGVPVKERILASGDEIKIGNSLFLFVLPETESQTAPLGGVRQRRHGLAVPPSSCESRTRAIYETSTRSLPPAERCGT